MSTTPPLLSPERLEEMQALRTHVRQSLKTAIAGNTGRSVVSFLRVESLLDEGDELQQAFAAYHSLVQKTLQDLLVDPLRLDNVLATRRSDSEEYNAKVHAAAQQLGITLQP